MQSIDFSPIYQYIGEHPVALIMTVLFIIAVFVFFASAINGIHKLTKK